LGGNEIIINHFNYLEIPIYTVVELPDLYISPFMLAGINMGYLLKATSKYYFYNDDFTEFYNRINFAIDVGLGIKYSFYKNICLQLSGRYSYGIRHIDKNSYDRHTRGIQILLGVLYSFY
jgi:hypothetical protein